MYFGREDWVIVGSERVGEFDTRDTLKCEVLVILGEEVDVTSFVFVVSVRVWEVVCSMAC